MIPAIWRLLREPPSDGAANMARDETLLASALRGAPPTLRLYAWAKPTLSLGAHQSSQDADLEACRRLVVDLVRRPTGGGAVLHDAEVTYAVAGRLGEDTFPRSVVGVYERIAAALVAGLARLGVAAESERSPGAGRAPADCFARPAHREILVAGRKLAGSAQVRRRGAFLQHGSILMAFDRTKLREVLKPARLAEPGPGPVTLGELTGRAIGRAELEEALVAGFSEVFYARLQPGDLDPRETEEAAALRAWKYLDARWTLVGHTRPIAE